MMEWFIANEFHIDYNTITINDQEPQAYKAFD